MNKNYGLASGHKKCDVGYRGHPRVLYVTSDWFSITDLRTEEFNEFEKLGHEILEVMKDLRLVKYILSK